jgi:hypothetical protein
VLERLDPAEEPIVRVVGDLVPREHVVEVVVPTDLRSERVEQRPGGLLADGFGGGIQI